MNEKEDVPPECTRSPHECRVLPLSSILLLSEIRYAPFPILCLYIYMCIPPTHRCPYLPILVQHKYIYIYVLDTYLYICDCVCMIHTVFSHLRICLCRCFYVCYCRSFSSVYTRCKVSYRHLRAFSCRPAYCLRREN